MALAPTALFVLGYSCSSAFEIRRSSSAAASRLTPSFSRAMAEKPLWLPRSVRLGVPATGPIETKKSCGRGKLKRGNSKPRGMTPTIVYCAPSRRSVRPRTFGSAFSCARQNASVTIAAAGAFGASSASVKARPSAGDTRSALKMFAVVLRARRRCARSPPVSVSASSRDSASASNDRARARQSR